MTMRDGNVINVTRTIDDGPVTKYQVIAIVLCSLVAFLDGIDTQSIALGAPLILESLHLARSTLGPIFSSGLFGAMIGALTFGPLGDRFGRKRVLVTAAFIFGVFTVAVAYATSYETLLVVRFLAGLGLGGATPCFIALASEYAPRRRRAMVASLMWAAFPLGGTLGGFANGAILQSYGWQTMFVIGGCLPIIAGVILMVWLPESLRFLVARGAPAIVINAIVRRIRPGLAPADRFVVDEERAHSMPLKFLFTDGRALTTLLLWVAFFMSFGILGIVVLWAPALLHDNGFPPSAAGSAIGINGLGALIGMASAGRLMERFGTLPVIMPSMLLGAVLTGALGYSATSMLSFQTVLFFGGMCMGMGAGGAIALAALTYPTAVRSSGVGWAMGMGRFGQVLAPLFTAAMVAAGWSGMHIFAMLGLAPAVAAVAVLVLRRTSASAEAAAPLAAE